tara:strand:+ start:156295 stop:156930 length:636 start_codon:yes stop_codon:yes gene_type:complete
MRVLVLFATEEGQTEKIAQRIAENLITRGYPTDLHNIANQTVSPVALDAYDAVVVGSPMHYSHYDAPLAEYLKQYKSDLREIPSAFFSVSLGILSKEESERAKIEQLTDTYLERVGWMPEIKWQFAGALSYSKYGWLKRHMMHWIAKKSGSDTDMRHDYEFTDWPKVDEFVEAFADFIESCKEPQEAHTRRSIYAQPKRRYSLKHRQAANG